MQTIQHQNLPANRKVVIGLWAVFITQFVSWLFINARNIAQPGIINELDGMSLFSWLIALAMTIALLLILSIPEISMDTESPEHGDSSTPAISIETSLS